MDSAFALSRSIVELIFFFAFALTCIYASQFVLGKDLKGQPTAQEQRVVELCEKAGGDLVQIGGASQLFCKLS
jgi:hypothetical protein